MIVGSKKKVRIKIKIDKASLDTYWYAKHIGEEFEVFGTCRDGYYVDEERSLDVLKDDCHEIWEFTNGSRIEAIRSESFTRGLLSERFWIWEEDEEGEDR